MSDSVADGWKWMPLSERRSDSPTYHDVLFEEPSGPLADALDGWISRSVRLRLPEVNWVERINILARREVLRLEPGTAAPIRADTADLVEVVDLVLHLLDESKTGLSAQSIHELRRMLDEGQSLWTTGQLPDQSLGLVQRVNDATLEQAQRVLSGDALAVTHLRRAWGEFYQRQSDPKRSLDESVLALESALRSIVSPRNDRVTLGTIIRDLRAKPGKWVVPIGTVTQLADRLDDIWRNQPRHGVDDENDVVDVGAAFADAALHEAIAIVHWCTTAMFGTVEAPDE